MTTPRALGALACAVALILVGCSPAEEPTPRPETPNISSPDQRYAEAEAVFRRVDAVNNANLFAGIYEPFPAELFELTADPYLTLAKNKYQDNKQRGVVLKNVDLGHYELKPYRGALEHDADVMLEGCADFSLVETYLDGHFQGRGNIAYEKYYFKSFEGRLKLIGISTQAVSSCSLA